MIGSSRWLLMSGLGIAGAAGCAGQQVHLPTGHLPAAVGPSDVRTAGVLMAAPVGVTPATPPPAGGQPAPVKVPFDLPRSLPGAAAPPVAPPRFPKDTPSAERDKTVQAVYPTLSPTTAELIPAASTPAMTLADLQQVAAENSPVLRRAAADADAAYGQVIQAGLHPNPNVGYQSDQVQPALRVPPGGTFSGAGQQGGFINQLIKTAGKLTLAQKVSGFDYINALVALRRSEVDVTAAVRTQYFAALVAQQGMEINRALVELADEVYRLQLKQVAAGEAAGYEPLQLYAQAEQARNALIQAENTYQASWKQLAAAVGRPDLPLARLAGKADAPVPALDYAVVQTRVLEQHTDLLTARNTVAQAQTNLTLQQRLPIPDLQTNQYHQYDNAAQTYQFGVQIGINLPLYDRNQGNIHTAQARVGRANADLVAVQNDLAGRLAEAFGRYNANRAVAERYRDKIIPNLTRAYRAIIRRYQVEPEKVGFNDIVVAQQNLAQALQAYLTALTTQWQAVVDVANIGQLDELYPDPPK